LYLEISLSGCTALAPNLIVIGGGFARAVCTAGLCTAHFTQGSHILPFEARSTKFSTWERLNGFSLEESMRKTCFPTCVHSPLVSHLNDIDG
jgi:hypothetical protein